MCGASSNGLLGDGEACVAKCLASAGEHTEAVSHKWRSSTGARPATFLSTLAKGPGRRSPRCAAPGTVIAPVRAQHDARRKRGKRRTELVTAAGDGAARDALAVRGCCSGWLLRARNEAGRERAAVASTTRP